MRDNSKRTGAAILAWLVPTIAFGAEMRREHAFATQLSRIGRSAMKRVKQNRHSA
jgi:hypothetical protein